MHKPTVDLTKPITLVFECRICHHPAFITIGTGQVAHAERLPDAAAKAMKGQS